MVSFALERIDMALSEPGKGRHTAWTDQYRPADTDPRLGFAVAILACAVVWVASTRALPSDAVMPAVSTVLLGFAALFGVIAWRRGRTDSANVTHADVAGALTLVGLCAAATIEPDQMVRLVQAGSAADQAGNLSSQVSMKR
jgi:hypothetical protein